MDEKEGKGTLYWFIVFLIAFFFIGALVISLGGN